LNRHDKVTDFYFLRALLLIFW